ncbi:MAG: Mrp/NBP35 family ATP-binding protein [Thermoanaerobacteraceae bacterium]|nr:Mrp/NBP35 family ATP-binding protein [Thermoanaerobacteraceae bacterium]
MIQKEQVIDALRKVTDPEIGKDLVTLNMIGDIAIEGSHVAVTIKLTVAGCPMKKTMEQDVKRAVGSLEGVEQVTVNFGEMTPEEKNRLAASLKQGSQNKAEAFKDVNVIAVGSGKGGVGKSTLAVNLAVALQQEGVNTGILDADILGFSVSTLLGIQDKRPVALDSQTILPIQVNGLKALSMGNLIKSDQALIWRAPVIRSVLDQFFYNVRWGDLDYLVIDLPPGTGDVPLTVMQQLPKAQLLLVTTPQSAAAKVSVRLGNMAKQMNIKTLGVVENMSYFQCPECERKYYIFGKGQSEKIAADLNVELLAQIPLNIEIRENSDAGTPIALQQDNPAASHYHELAQKIIKQLS